MKIPREIKDLIEAGCPAHLITLNRDGSPQVTLIWIGLDGDEVVAAHLPKNQKVISHKTIPGNLHPGVNRHFDEAMPDPGTPDKFANCCCVLPLVKRLC